ncbi:uncharacterized protein ACBR49_003804 [Aulostomus maculatus]
MAAARKAKQVSCLRRRSMAEQAVILQSLTPFLFESDTASDPEVFRVSLIETTCLLIPRTHRMLILQAAQLNPTASQEPDQCQHEADINLAMSKQLDGFPVLNQDSKCERGPGCPAIMSVQKYQMPHKLKVLRRLMYASPVISILSVILLLWIFRPDRTLLPQIHVQLTEPQMFGAKQPVAQGANLSFVAVPGTKTLLVSAYMEQRAGGRQVRVIAVVLRSEPIAYCCILHCQEQLHISEGIGHVHSDHFGFVYGTSDIMCPLPSGCKTPTHVAVTSATASNDRASVPPDMFLEVRNQEEKSDTFPHNFTICLSTMFDFSNVLQLVQSLEMFQLLGVSRVVVYKTSCNPETQRLLDYYTQKGLVEVIPWTISRHVNVSRGWLPEHGPGELHYFGQIAALNDCVYRYMYQSRYVALQDIDELILPQSVNSWQELLPLLEKKYGADKCYMFENNVFPNTVSLSPPSSRTPGSPSWKNVPGVNILAHLHHEPIIPETHYSNFKIIVSPRAVFIASVHGLIESQAGCSWVDRDIARMYHTRAPKQTNLTPDQLIYDGRLLRYSAALTLAVDTTLRDNGLLPEDSRT